MKTKYMTLKSNGTSEQCSICSAKFEIWLSNARLSDEKRERISTKLTDYCPACKRADEK
jgi:hypothetical protein